MWMVVRESVCSTPHPEGIDYKFSKSDTYNGTSDGLSASLHQIITSGKHYCALNYLSNVSVVVGTGIDPVTGSSAPAQTITWDDSENADGKITKFHYSMTYIWSATKWLEVKTTQN